MVTVTATGTITVTPNNTISLTSAVGTNAQTVCINTAINRISRIQQQVQQEQQLQDCHAGVTGNWAANMVTISGTPTASGTFNYTVTLTGGCGTLQQRFDNRNTEQYDHVTSAAVPMHKQFVSILRLTNITYTTTGATGATFSWITSRSNWNWAANIVTISGTPTASGTFNYTVH